MAEHGRIKDSGGKIGTSGSSPWGRARLGSVSTKVLRAAKGPVLICPGARDSGLEESQG